MADLVITAANVVAAAGASRTAGVAGAVITAGQAVYLDAATGKFLLADSNAVAAAARVPLGIALNSAAANQPLQVGWGEITIGATMTPGLVYYLSDTPGGICPVADVGSGEYVCVIGIAASASLLSVKIHAVNVAL